MVMNGHLKILHLEDSKNDAELIAAKVDVIRAPRVKR